MAKFLTIHGPNLNRLSEREPAIYGNTSLDTIDQRLQTLAEQHQHQMLCAQYNAEYAMLERIHAASGEGIAVIIINPAALGHTSIALRDALLSVTIPFVEVHLSNIYAREPFRHHSFLSDKAIGVITGFGALSYELALRAAIHYVE